MNPRLFRRFLAIAKYEMLLTLRKKKLLAMMIIALVASVLQLVLPPVLRIANNEPLLTDPDYLLANALGSYGGSPLSASGAGSFLLFIFAAVVFMDTVSAEFESGSIIPLLTKPVSRNLVFLAKLLGAFLTLAATYGLLYLILFAGSLLIYGPQSNLHAYPALIGGVLVGTLVFGAVVLFMGSIRKSSIIAAIGSFGVLIGLFIAGGILDSFGGQGWVLTYAPGIGRSAVLAGQEAQTFFATGTSAAGASLAYYLLHPDTILVYVKTFSFPLVEVSRETLYDALTRQLLVATFYIVALTGFSWYLFKRAEITEA